MYEIIIKAHFIFTYAVPILLFISKFLLASFPLPFPYFLCAWRISFNVSFRVDLLVMNSVSCHMSEKFFTSALILKDIFSEYRILDYSFSFFFFTILKILPHHLMAYIFSRKNLSSYTFSLCLKDFLLITSFKQTWKFFYHNCFNHFFVHCASSFSTIPNTCISGSLKYSRYTDTVFFFFSLFPLLCLFRIISVAMSSSSLIFFLKKTNL